MLISPVSILTFLLGAGLYWLGYDLCQIQVMKAASHFKFLLFEWSVFMQSCVVTPLNDHRYEMFLLETDIAMAILDMISRKTVKNPVALKECYYRSRNRGIMYAKTRARSHTCISFYTNWIELKSNSSLLPCALFTPVIVETLMKILILGMLIVDYDWIRPKVCSDSEFDPEAHEKC